MTPSTTDSPTTQVANSMTWFGYGVAALAVLILSVLASFLPLFQDSKPLSIGLAVVSLLLIIPLLGRALRAEPKARPSGRSTSSGTHSGDSSSPIFGSFSDGGGSSSDGGGGDGGGGGGGD